MVLGQDQLLPLIKEELVPQGYTKDAMARNANLEPLNVTGMAALLIIHVNAEKTEDYKNDHHNDIIAVAVEDIPQQPPYAPLIINVTDNNNDNDLPNNDNNKGSSNDDLLDGDNKDALGDPATVSDADKDKPQEDSNQGVQRLQRKGRGATKKYVDYNLLMAAKRERRGGPRWALIHNGWVLFWQTTYATQR